MSFRNFKTLYSRTSDHSGQPIISMYDHNVPFPVWDPREWWSDEFNPLNYGRDIDFSGPFFPQLKELFNTVPRLALMNIQSESCEFTNLTYSSSNCYLVFGCVDNEDCVYGHIVWESKDCVDNLYVHKSERCYECVDVLGSYQLLYSQECEDCSESLGLFDCRSCSNCIGCVGLRQKSYYLFNEPVGKEGIEQFLKDHPLSDPATIKLIAQKQAELRAKHPHKATYGSKNENVTGNHIYNAKNLQNVFDVKGGEDSSYILTGRKPVDTRDISFSVDMELVYQGITAADCTRTMMFDMCSHTSDVAYSHACFNTRNAFGCVGIKSGEYHILNKQYSKEEYESLEAKLIDHMKQTGEWGQYFPKDLSPFGYNETIAQEYMPLQQAEAEAKGFRWHDNIPGTTGQETKQHDELPTDPNQYTAALTQEVLKCDTCQNNYRLVAQELAFYRELGLPLPRECFNCRHARRMAQRNPRVLHNRQCDCAGSQSRNGTHANVSAQHGPHAPSESCPNTFETSFPHDGQEIVYCEECYQEEVA